MDLSTARAVVTGGASGLGFASAKRIVEAGGHAVLLDVNADQGSAAASELGERAMFIQTDVSSEEAVRAAMHDCDIDHAKVNVNGGACALGHPIGATGARITTTLLHAMRARNLKRGIATQCIGGGEATAVALEID